MLKIEEGQYVETPRFLKVKIFKIFENEQAAELEGYTEPTHFKDLNWNIKGWLYDTNMMKFCAIKK